MCYKLKQNKFKNFYKSKIFKKFVEEIWPKCWLIGTKYEVILARNECVCKVNRD